MHPRLASTDRFQDLLIRRPEDHPYVFASLFSNDGWAARRQSKKKLKLLKQIDATCRSMLDDGETVHFVTVGNGVSFWESYLLGWIAYYINRRAIILTDRRIILLQVDRKCRPHTLRSQLRYPTIYHHGTSFLGRLKLTMRGGKKHLLAYMPRKDRGRLRQLIDHKKLEFKAYKPEALDMENLCPYCHRLVAGRPKQCAHCTGRFKSSTKAVLLSLLFPGLGELYLGHTPFAVLEIIGAATLWVGFLLSIPMASTGPLPMALGAAVLFVFMHGLDALTTRYIARKGIYPAEPPRVAYASP